jgi:penicillin-binding protein 2
MREHRTDEAHAVAVFNRRAILLGFAHVAVSGVLAARLYQLQVVDSGRYGALADDNRTRQIALPPRRGRILDATGLALAWNNESFKVSLDGRSVTDLVDLRATLRQLAPVLGLDDDAIETLLARARSQGARQQLIIADAVTFESMAALQVRFPELVGVRADPISTRSYAAVGASSMSHIVGYVGAVNKRALDDDPLLRSSDVRIGKTGVEAGMEADLRGVPGSSAIEIDARGKPQRNLRETSALPGRDVTLSIETTLQSTVLERLNREGRPAAVVAMDVLTGELAVMASTPTYDPTTLSGRGAAATWQALTTDKQRPLLNRCIAGQYPPGSTFKLVTAIAALEAGVLTPKEKIECWGDITVAGQLFRCWNRKGHISSDLHKALRESCDCYFYEVARRVGMEGIASMARRLGLGQTFDAGLAQQKNGLLPTWTWKRGRSRIGWLTGETLMAGIGQGYVLATPLQLAVMTARIATGTAVSPTVLKRSPNDGPILTAPLGISEPTLAAIRRAMVAVVNEPGGTGLAADYDDGRTLIAGKTGTSQVSSRSADRDPTIKLAVEHRDHALFVAYVPADKPRYAVSAIIENAGSGGALAAPLVGDVIKALLARDKSREPPAPVGSSTILTVPTSRGATEESPG